MQYCDTWGSHSATGWTPKENVFRFPVGGRGTFQSAKTGSEAHMVSNLIGTGGAFPGCKAAGAWK
jgi:hypothetical protein